MQVVIVICDNFKQYKEYMAKITVPLIGKVVMRYSINGIWEVDDTRYIALCCREDVKKLLGIEREGIEIRIIGNKGMYSLLTLKGSSGVFGL